MPKTNSPANHFPPVLGLDVSKATVTLHDLASGRSQTIANEAEPLRDALAACPENGLIVCEATGGYERTCLAVALSLGRDIHRADAARVKAFIRSHGEQAKTDKRDAYWIARYGAERFDKLPRWQPQSAARDALADYVRHRMDLVKQKVAINNRLKSPSGDTVKKWIRKELAFYKKQIADIDAQIAKLIASDPELKTASAHLEQIKGFGVISISTLLGLVPELGQLNRKQAASLTGFAPHPRQSGQWTGRGRMGGGRGGLRPILFMAALSAARSHPELSEFYQRLINNGKPKLVALAAVARKLVTIANAVLRPVYELT